MNDFNYYAPTKVVFGKGAEQKVGNLIKEQNCKKVLIHYGSGSARRSGLLDRIEAIFDKEGITYVELGGVVPNPRLSLVYEGIALCKKENVDFILAVGGGSVIDSAKAIGYGVANEGDVWDFFDFKRKPTACLPIGVVLTIAAAGSEMSGSCVITKEDGGMKRGCTTDYSRLKFAVLDPELTMTLPPYQTACGCTDILMHTMERYFNHGENMELTAVIGRASPLHTAIFLCYYAGTAHLTSRRRDRKHYTDRQTCSRFPFKIKEIPHVSFICNTISDRLCGINDTSAADGKDEIDIFFFTECDSFIHQRKSRVWNNTAQFDVSDPLFIKDRLDPV
jgi:hypothetical protein